MIGAALLAKKAVEKGLSRKPWVKTTLAPGSKVVMDYYERAGLIPYLDKLGFNLVGYGCTTCIGNSGPLPTTISEAVNENDLTVVSVLSGNRNFEGRINPDVKMNYLASPPLVVAYALAGTMDIDLDNEPLGTDPDGNPVFLKDIWPSPQEVPDRRRLVGRGGHVHHRLRRRVQGRRQLAQPRRADRRHVRLGRSSSTYVARPPYFDGMPASPAPVTDIHGAKVLAKLGDSVTTDHISPAGAIKATAPAGLYLTEHGIEPEGLQLLRVPARQPRGDDPRNVRQHPAPQPARARHRGRRHQEGRPGDVDLRRLPGLHRRGHPAASSSAARSTAPVPPATGRPRAPRCSASGPCSSSRSSASTGPT